MNSFTYQNPTKLIFGNDAEKTVGAELKALGIEKILLHYGQGSIKQNGVYKTVTASLKDNGISFVELNGVMPNPHLSLVKEGVAICKENNIQLVLAVGGGSVIDSAKAIAMGAVINGDLWETFRSRSPVNRALKVATVLTIPAAGSEASPNTVITDEVNKDKVGYGSPLLYPVFSIINPQLFASLSNKQLANGISDMLSHIMERYFTNTPNTDLTDALCEGTMRTIIKNARILIKEPKNQKALEQIGLCGTIAHNGILGIGREQDWACHGAGHELSGLYNTAHGSTLSIITPAWMKYVKSENPSIFTQFATNVFGVNIGSRNVEEIADCGIYMLENFYRELGLPTTMNEINANPQDYEYMAKKSTREGTKYQRTLGGIKKLNHKDVLAIYNIATNK